MDNKITIIEGPTPTFETVQDSDPLGGGRSWAHGILEGPYLSDVAMTTLRTFNSDKLMQRCEDAWSEKQTMYLEYRDRIGLTKQTPIVAARAAQMEEGDVLLLWVLQEMNFADTEENYPDLDEDQ